MRYFSFNGKLLPEGSMIIGPDNRGLRYGDGLFETMKFANGSIILLDEHLQRLWKGLHLLNFELPHLCTMAFISGEMLRLLKKNKDVTARVRLTVIRGDGGLFDPTDHKPNFIIQTWPLPHSSRELNNNGLQLCIYPSALKACDLLSNLKHNNYLCYVMGALYAKNNKCNDAIILNQHQRICDSTIANIFVIKDKIISTPSLAEGCVAGIMRQLILDTLPVMDFTMRETEITTDLLLSADEVFLTNSMYNIRWVRGISETVYAHGQVHQIFDALCETKGNVFC